MYKTDIMTLYDEGNNIERILAMVWLDADAGIWPIQNAGQRKTLIEIALKELKQLQEKRLDTS